MYTYPAFWPSLSVSLKFRDFSVAEYTHRIYSLKIECFMGPESVVYREYRAVLRRSPNARVHLKNSKFMVRCCRRFFSFLFFSFTADWFVPKWRIMRLLRRTQRLIYALDGSTEKLRDAVSSSPRLFIDWWYNYTPKSDIRVREFAQSSIIEPVSLPHANRRNKQKKRRPLMIAAKMHETIRVPLSLPLRPYGYTYKLGRASRVYYYSYGRVRGRTIDIGDVSPIMLPFALSVAHSGDCRNSFTSYTIYSVDYCNLAFLSRGR